MITLAGWQVTLIMLSPSAMAADDNITQTGSHRLMISKIVCENFKSYAGIKELGPFHKCFTSIVGPNGSGKSNVIDSLLFVFGYRAKKIRSKSVSVLIHNSDQHTGIQSCSVAVHFQEIVDIPGDEFEIVPNSHFVISRTAHKDNTSYYSLNGKKVQFKEVAALLRKSGIDLDHNRFLILQGEVEQIALMKPKALTDHDEGMLEFLEDIIGSSKYKQPIEELGKRVEELNEARGEKLNRVKAVEKEKAQLEGAKNEAEEYLSMQKEVAKKQYVLYGRYKYECCQLRDKAMESKVGIEERLSEVNEKLAKCKAEKGSKVKVHKKLLKAHEQNTQKKDNCQSKMRSLEQRDLRMQQEIKNKRALLKKTNKSLQKEKEKLVDLETTPERSEREIKECEIKLKILEKRKLEEEEKLSAVMASIKADTQGLQDDKEKLETQLVALSQKVNEAKSVFDLAQAEFDMYHEKCTAGERQLVELKKKLKSNRNNFSEKKRLLSELKKHLPSKQQELSELESTYQQVSERLNKLLQHHRATNTKLQESTSALQIFSSRGKVLEALMQQKESEAIPGIFGRLGDLGSIDDKYDVAISTACSALDHIVVDTMETAMACVEFLKSNSIGRASFIGLDKMGNWQRQATSTISTPENVPRLFDLVKPRDPKFLTAFYFALRDTLVADDLTQATRIGLQGKTRHHVVTLNGQLIDASGTMSGGGSRQVKGKMSAKMVADVTPHQLSQLEKQFKMEEADINECSQNKLTIEQKLKSFQTKINDDEREIKQLQRDCQVLETQEKALTERITSLENESQSNNFDPNHTKALEKKVHKTQEDYKGASKAADEIKSQVQVLHDQIMDIGGSQMKKQQAHVDCVKKEIKETSASITKLNVSIKTAKRNETKCRDKICSLENELKSTEQHIQDLKAEMATIETEAGGILEEQENLQSTLDELDTELGSLKVEIDSIEIEERHINENNVDLLHELELYATKVKENQQKIKHFQNEISKLALEKEDLIELSVDELDRIDKKEVEYQITMFEQRLRQMTPNMAAIEEYRKKDELHQARMLELDAITNDRDKARKEYDNLRKQRLNDFMSGFSIITNKLKEMYQMITLGGDAELELVDSLDPFSEGIVFSVRPPKKSWKNISNLSGGEKTLSSLALVFALHHYKPSPLYVMDEIDAALDFKNVSIVANYIKERTKNAQFIIISLRNNMFELADRLVGIYKTSNCTKSVTINPEKISKGALVSA